VLARDRVCPAESNKRVNFRRESKTAADSRLQGPAEWKKRTDEGYYAGSGSDNHNSPLITKRSIKEDEGKKGTVWNDNRGGPGPSGRIWWPDSISLLFNWAPGGGRAAAVVSETLTQ
jgi:hypothetical protein